MLKQTRIEFAARLHVKIVEEVVMYVSLLPTTRKLDNGKAIRETMAADLPLSIDHFRYFAG